ncbi:MAG: CHC2 zinc finger domain-containing protein [Prosthecobacter sp.]|nr:CHC2 zinc finger domain-containing protein [Prosthecobacter sp.]
MVYAVDFAEVKARFSIEQVAALLGLDGKMQNGQLRCACPVHDGGSRALVITPAKEAFYCFAPECKTGGDLIELYAHAKQLSVKDAALELARFGGEELRPLDYLLSKHPLVQALGISEEHAGRAGVGYAPRGTLVGRVALPLRDGKGKLIAYAGFAEHLRPRLKFGKFRL